jgi:hypothetical protein
MDVFWAAILAVALGGRLDEPRIVRFMTADGGAVSGEATAWEALKSTFVSMEVQNEPARDANRSSGLPSSEDERRSVESERLRTQTPEASNWPAVPWPAHDALDRVAAVPALRDETRARLERSGIAAEPVETEHFLVYAELPRLEAAQLAARMESVHAWLAEQVGVDPAAPHYWGKAVVICVADPDRFRLLEAEAFGQLAGRELKAICHPVGEKVFIVLRGEPSGPAAIRAAVHAFMHRYRSPRRLPPWANEGFASFAAAVFAPGPWAEAERRGAIAFLRGGGDVRGVLNATYDLGWPGPGGVGPALGALFVELLVAEKPAAFRAWVRLVKGGAEWLDAMNEVYGSPTRLVDTFVQYYRVND